MGLLDFVLHFDKHLFEFVRDYGSWVYAILFTIVFAETGFVVTPFLPGDSLLFATGALFARGDLSIAAMRVLLIVGALACVSLCVYAGWFFGNIPIIKDNFSLVTIGIVVVSVLPMVFELIASRRRH